MRKKHRQRPSRKALPTPTDVRADLFASPRQSWRMPRRVPGVFRPDLGERALTLSTAVESFCTWFILLLRRIFPSFALVCEMPQSLHTAHFVGRDSLTGRFTSGGRRTDDFRPNLLLAESSTTRLAEYRDFVFRAFFNLPEGKR